MINPDVLINSYDEGFKPATIVSISISRTHWLAISDRITQLRQELSLAEEGLANYAQEVEQLKAENARLLSVIDSRERAMGFEPLPEHPRDNP